jgi:nucleoid DNA-binding protein
MCVRQWIVLAGLLGSMGVMLTSAGPAHSQRQPPPAEETLSSRVAKTAKLSEQDVAKVLQALGAAVQEELKAGKTVTLPGLGTFRVVRIAEHKNMEVPTGRPVTVPATNNVEFLAGGELLSAANSASAKPAETVPDFRYIVIPNRVPSSRMPNTKVRGPRNP